VPLGLTSTPTARILISALEPSADRHAAALVAAARHARPGLEFVGPAGPRMRDAGCRPISDLTARSAMLLGAASLLGDAARLLRRLDHLMASGAIDLVLPVDSPAFHFHLARRAKARGLPVVYFIAPQVWAWAPWRIHKLRRCVDRMAVILPFEQAYFRDRGVDATYVGHPLIESLSQTRLDAPRRDAFRALGDPIITCLPGSRRHVIREVLPGQIAVARQIHAHHPNAHFLFAAASDEAAALIHTYTNARYETCPRTGAAPKTGATGGSSASAEFCTDPRRTAPGPLPHDVVTASNAEAIAAADLVLVASGTATLEVAYHARPMIVMYNASKWGYRLVARWLIATAHLSLVNILAGRTLVPEFMPYYDSPQPIADAALQLLADSARRDAMQRDLAALVDPLRGHQVGREAAAIVLETLDATHRAARRTPRGSRHHIW
jgi:lipid-A-disaccharide synthase